MAPSLLSPADTARLEAVVASADARLARWSAANPARGFMEATRRAALVQLGREL